MKSNFGWKDTGTLKFWRAVVAEFFGCLLFLLCVTCVALSWGPPPYTAAAVHVEIGIGIGFGISTLAYAFGHVSGGHLNPAVSLGMVVGGRISIIKGIMYIIFQVAGAIVGSALTYACVPKKYRQSLGVTSLIEEVTSPQGFGLELLFTFILVFYVLSITDPTKKVNPLGAAVGIGLTILVCHVCLIPLTGCGINPARSFGPAIVMNNWKDHWIYWAGPLAGGVLAALFYKFVFYTENDDSENSKEAVDGNRNQMYVVNTL